VAGLVILGIPVASASEPVTAKAVTAQAVTAQAVTAKAATAKAATAKAATAQAITAKAITAQAITAQAITAKAITAKAITFALITGVFIAAYTLWDKYAVSTLKIPSLVQGYASLPMMALVLAPFALRDTGRTARVWRTYRRQVLGAAALSPLAYILVLTALSFTAVSAVAPAREVSVLFGVVLGRKLLGEGSLARRLVAAGTIAAGIICIAVG
jgi:drug/metabolite transporter (DMT)-like permease